LVDIARARVLVISDGRAGSVNQSLGLAAMLGFKDPELLGLQKKTPSPLLRWLPVGMLYSKATP
jgi:mitochondrial fission protein ELM1